MAIGTSKPWGWLRMAALQIVGTLLAIYLVLEIWARLFPPKDKPVWPLMQNPAVGTTLVPNARVVVTNGLDFHVEETSNEVGFLDRPLPPVARTKGACRIALLGDSFVEGAQVPIRQKVQVELERLIKVRWPGMSVETMAFGFSGTGQLNQLGYLETYVRPRKPDLVVLVFVSNDFANNSALLESIRVGWNPAHTPRIFAREQLSTDGTPGRISLQPIDPQWMSKRLPAANDERPWLHVRLHRASRFYRWLYAKLSIQYPGVAAWMGREPSEADRTAARMAALKSAAPEAVSLLDGWNPATSPGLDNIFEMAGPLPPAFEQALRFTGFAFDTYKERAAADGAKLVVLATHEIKTNMEKRLIALLEPRGIPLILQRSHIAARKGNIADAQWRHDGHWSAQGHTWAAEALLDHIAASGACANVK